MKKFFIRTMLLVAMVVVGATNGDARTVSNYSEGFDKLDVSKHDFAPNGWKHKVDYLAATGWSDDVYVEYSVKTSGGQDGAYLQCGSQSVYNDDYDSKNCEDMLVTPEVSGTVSFYIKSNYTSSLGTVKVYKCTVSGTTFTIGDEVSLGDFAISGEWQQVTITADEPTVYAIYLNKAGIDSFTASSADVPDVRSAEITYAQSAIPSNPSYADADGNVAFKTVVKIKNTGNVDLVAGDEGYSVDMINYSTKAVYGSYTPTFNLAVGEESPEFEIEAVYTLADPTTDARFRADVRENITSTTKIVTTAWSSPWVDVVAYVTNLKMTYNGSSYDGTKVMNLGLNSGSATATLKLKNAGGAPLTIDGVTLAEGVTNTLTFPLTLNAGEEAEDVITITGDGALEGSVVYGYEGEGVNEFKYSAVILGANTYLETFEHAGDLPISWIIPADSKWSVAEVPYAVKTATNKYCMKNSISDPLTSLISPKITYAEGENLGFYAMRQSSYSSCKLIVSYSTDRKNWTQVYEVTSTTGSGDAQFTSSTSEFSFFTVPMPAGDYYLKFDAGYCYLDNVLGGKLTAVDHDLLVSEFKTPSSAMVNNEFQVLAQFKNINTIAEEADAYTVKLYANDEEIGSLPGQLIASNDASSFLFSYTPHAEGDIVLKAVAEFTDGYTVASDEVTVNVKPETATEIVSVGTVSTTATSVPLSLNYKNSMSEIVYKAADLKMASGSKLTSISFPYYKTSDDQVINVSVWLANTSDETPNTTDKAFADTTAMTQVYHLETTILKAGDKDNLATWTLDFNEPFEYTGENLRVIIRSEASTYKQTYFGKDSSKSITNLLKKSDSYNTFKTTASVNTNTDFPVAMFAVSKSVPTISGVVKCTSTGEPIANAAISIVSGDVVYNTETAEDGTYSISIYQPDKTYNVEVSCEGYVTYTEEDVTFEADETINYELELISVSVNNVDAANVKVYTTTGKLNVVAPEGSVIKVYTVSGMALASARANGETTAISLERGIYIVTVDTERGRTVKKVMVK